jgi:hypothetical protein
MGFLEACILPVLSLLFVPEHPIVNKEGTTKPEDDEMRI